jgi:hypothetical protein
MTPVSVSLQEIDENLLRELAEGFAGRGSVGPEEAAKLLKMTEKTLRRHLASGDLTFVDVGTGLERPRRRFTLTDLVHFYVGRRRRMELQRGAPRRPARMQRLTFAESVPRPVPRRSEP